MAQIGRNQTYRAVIEHPLVAGPASTRGSIQLPEYKGILRTGGSDVPDHRVEAAAEQYAAPPASSGGGGVGRLQLRRGQAEADPEAHAEADSEAHREALAQRPTPSPDATEASPSRADRPARDGWPSRSTCGRACDPLPPTAPADACYAATASWLSASVRTASS